MAPRYLIIGASGFVGTRLYDYLGSSKAVATHNTRPIAGGVAFDAIRDRLADAVLKKQKHLTHAFILHGITNIDACSRDPSGTEQVNVGSVRKVIDELADHGIMPVFFSSDAVFDGSRGVWTERDEAKPILTYGRHKIAIEEYLARGSQPYLVVRMSKVITTRQSGGDMLGEWMDRLDLGREIRCAADQVFSPVNIDDAVDACLRLAESGQTGVFHVCSPAPVSRLGLLQNLVEEIRRLRDIKTHIIPCSIRDFDFAEPRPLDTSMSPAKLYKAIGRSFDGLDVVCRKAAVNRYAAQEQV